MIRPPSKETWVIAIGMAVLIGGLGSVGLRRAPDGVSNVTLDASTFDFGKARQGRELTHSFRFRNGGNVAIVLTRTESSCSCTTTEGLEGTTINAESDLDFKVMLKTGGSQGLELGQITLYYRSAAAADMPVHFTVARVKADVVPDYVVYPTMIDFGTVDHLQPISRTVRFRPVAQDDATITRLSSSHPSLSARTLEASPGARDSMVEITFSGRSLWESGQIEATTSIETTSPDCPKTQVLARAIFVAPIEVNPTSIVVGAGETGLVEREIRINAALPIQIAAFRSTDPAVRLVNLGSDHNQSLRVLATFLDDCRHPINAELSIDLEGTPGADATEARTVKIPAHRLATKE